MTRYTTTHQGQRNDWSPSMTSMQREKASAPFAKERRPITDNPYVLIVLYSAGLAIGCVALFMGIMP